MQMLELVRISHHIDRCDLPVRYFERRCLKLTICFQRDEARQSVDETGTNELRGLFAEKARNPREELQHGVEPKDRLRRCRTLAAAIGMEADVSRQHGAKRLHIAAA